MAHWLSHTRVPHPSAMCWWPETHKQLKRPRMWAIPGEPIAGIDDVHSHPTLPRTARVRLIVGF